ncbi:MAG: aldo/keto reductase [Acidimicrobiales bacterium]
MLHTRRLGRTGHHSSVAIFGGALLWDATPEEAAEAVTLADSHGVNHLDIAPRYGVAEEVIGPALAPLRHRWFVAAKTTQPSRDKARAELERTLTRLGTDHLDLYQLHAVTSVEELDTRAGAVEALLAARDEGLVRYLGVTGHDLGAPTAHLEALHRYDFDTVMFPVYPRVWADPVYRRDAETLLAACTERDVGAMAIKAVAWRPWGDQTRPTDSPWYQPHTDPALITRGVGFALSVPGITGFCTPGSRSLLPAVLEAAEAVSAAGALDDTGRNAAMAAVAGDELIFPLAEKFRRD